MTLAATEARPMYVDVPPPALADHVVRRAAIQYVSDLVRAYRSMLGNPAMSDQKRAGLKRHANDLLVEIATMQAAGARGATLARRWCLLHGLGGAA